MNAQALYNQKLNRSQNFPIQSQNLRLILGYQYHSKVHHQQKKFVQSSQNLKVQSIFTIKQNNFIAFLVKLYQMKAADITLIFILWLVGLSYLYPNPPQLEEIVHTINQRTLKTIQHLVQTKFFRIIRLNINQACPLGIMNKICKSESCTLCRCNPQDIPQTWDSTQKVLKHFSNQDLWQNERSVIDSKWVWHVEDEKNDLGEYFDLQDNIESFTNYNGSFIWKIIYEENCFPHKDENICTEEKVLYHIISGLHASITTHLCKFYRYTAEQNKWADLKSTNQTQNIYTFNSSLYQQRILKHPQRIKNLLFVYSILAKAIVEAGPFLTSNFSITSNDITQDILAKNYLLKLYEELKGYDLTLQEKQALKFFKFGNPLVKQYQKYIHNISDILNCVECQKCRLFFKMQTYGVGTALKILLGYPSPYKRNEIVALLNVFSKVSVSVDTYFSQRHESQLSKGGSMLLVYLWMGVVFLSLYVNRKYKLF